jgi:LuxR family maltose regulon positive regulatory protein
VDEALDHAQQGGHADVAATLVERSIRSSMDRGDFPAIERQLRRLPADVVASRPWLILGRAWVLNFRSRVEAIVPTLAPLETAIERQGEELDQTEVDALRSFGDTVHALAASVTGERDVLKRMAARAYDRLPPTSRTPRPQAVAMLGLGYHRTGETDEGVRFLEAASQEEPGEDGPVRQHALWCLALIRLASAQPRTARQVARDLLAAAPEARLLIRCWAHYLHGLASYELDRLDEAREHFLVVDQLRRVAPLVVLRGSLLGLARIEQLTGDVEGARTTLQALEALPDVAQNARAQAVVRIFAARLALETGAGEEARDHLLGLSATKRLTSTETLAGSPMLAWARLLLEIGGDAGLAGSARILDALAAHALSDNEAAQEIGVLAMRALLRQAQGDMTGALHLVRQAVDAAAPGGLVRTFVDLGQPMQSLLSRLARHSPSPDPYVARLIASFPTTSGPLDQAAPSRHGPQIGPDLIESLTRRESEVLELLDARYSNKEIAESLQISAETVKRHNCNIFQKLMVGTRREAVARAREQGLLSPVLPRPPRYDERTA